MNKFNIGDLVVIKECQALGEFEIKNIYTTDHTIIYKIARGRVERTALEEALEKANGNSKEAEDKSLIIKTARWAEIISEDKTIFRVEQNKSDPDLFWVRQIERPGIPIQSIVVTEGQLNLILKCVKGLSEKKVSV